MTGFEKGDIPARNRQPRGNGDGNTSQPKNMLKAHVLGGNKAISREMAYLPCISASGYTVKELTVTGWTSQPKSTLKAHASVGKRSYQYQNSLPALNSREGIITSKE